MTAPAGDCEVCGGPQWWTFHNGEMYVKCQSGCLPLPLEGFSLLDSDGLELTEDPDGTNEGEEGVLL